MANVLDEMGAELKMPRGTSKVPASFPGWAPFDVSETDLEYGTRILTFLFKFWKSRQKKSKQYLGGL